MLSDVSSHSMLSRISLLPLNPPSHSTFSLHLFSIHPLTHLFLPSNPLVRWVTLTFVCIYCVNAHRKLCRMGSLIRSHKYSIQVISCQYTLATNPINTPYQPTLSTHPINTPYQHTLYQPILSTHPIKTPY